MGISYMTRELTREAAEAIMEDMINAYLDDRLAKTEELRVFRFGGLLDLTTMLHKLVSKRIKKDDPYSEWAIAAEALEELETTLSKIDEPAPYIPEFERCEDYLKFLRISGAV